MKLVDRDFLVLREVGRFRFMLGRHIKALCGFPSTSSCDKRLKDLIEAKYLSRKKYLYGVPGLYTLTHKGRIILSMNKREDKIRVDRITHDIYVLEAVIFFVKKYGLAMSEIKTEKELHIKDGFGTRKHQPDFVLTNDGQSQAVEVELNPKSKERLEKNIRDNYLNFDKQIWITNDNKIISLITKFLNEYPNIEILRLEEVIL